MNDADREIQRDPSADSDSVQLADILEFIGRHWQHLLVAAVLGGALGLALSFAFQPIYRADAVLIAGDDFGEAATGEGGGVLGGLGGAAALLGVGQTGGHQVEAMAVLKSRSLIEAYLQEKQLLPELYPHKWDPERKAWRNNDPAKVPKMTDAFEYFSKKILSVSEDKKTGLVTVAIQWHDPNESAQWLADLVERTNAILRTRSIERAERDLTYLNEQLAQATVVELRAAISKLIETEVKKMMIAQGSRDYAFRYVDPPVVPEKPVFPKKALFAGGGVFLGLLAGAIFGMARERRQTLP